jgi:hypothetical protein
VIFCLRFMNFCVLTALGVLLMAPIARLDRSVDAQLPGYLPRAPFFISAADRDRYSGQLMARLAVMKVQIHTDVCRRSAGALTLFHARDCGPNRDS